MTARTHFMKTVVQESMLVLRGRRSFAEVPMLVSVALKRIARAIRRSLSRATLRVDARTGKAIVRTSQSPQAIDAAVIWPGTERRLYFTNVKAGRFTLQVEHQDPLIFGNRRALIARFWLSNDSQSEIIAREMGLQIGDRKEMYAYLGGGQQRNGRYSQAIVIKVPKDQRWLRVSLSSPYERFINIDRISFGSNECAYLRSRVEELLTHDIADSEFILYADIDVNAVDGSSIWLSSMASLLCGLGRCILVSKCNVRSEIVLSNIAHRENLTIVSPSDLNLGGSAFDMADAIELVRILDANLPKVRNVIVRGLDAGVALHSTRQFRERSSLYLTDFYKVTGGERVISEEQRRKSAMCALQAGTILVQTRQIEEELRAVTEVDLRAFELPPPIPDELPEVSFASRDRGPLRIGYAGKINPDWGIAELLDWVEDFEKEGTPIELHIVANKITEAGGEGPQAGFRASILERMRRVRAKHYQDLNREAAMALMSRMDFVWCWRPARLEEATLELSTKLVEMVASGARCICYPSRINRNALGEGYPFYATGREDLRRVLATEDSSSDTLMSVLRSKHAMTQVREKYWKTVLGPKVVLSPRRICIAAHDFKFIDPYLSHLKAIGHEVIRDEWRWGEPLDLQRSERARDWADTVICEWGLANAVWYSSSLRENQKLYIRLHAQEVHERARKFGARINVRKVTKFIFVSEDIRRRAVELFGWPQDKTIVIPNFVLTDEYVLAPRRTSQRIALGLVGIVPSSKRFDRAVETLAALCARGHDAVLYVKGHRPENLAFMRAPGRRHELVAYEEIYRRIESDPTISARVFYEPWGNDVGLFYRSVDYILSPSEQESFHYALADGILSGSHPVIWEREGVERLYSSEWVVSDVCGAVERIIQLHSRSLDERERIARANRTLVVSRYGHKRIFRELSSSMHLDEWLRSSAGYGSERGVFLDVSQAETWDGKLKEHAQDYLRRSVNKFRSILGGSELKWLESLFMPAPGFPMVSGVWLGASGCRDIAVPVSRWAGVRMDLLSHDQPWRAIISFGESDLSLRGKNGKVTATLAGVTRRVNVRPGGYFSVSALRMPGRESASVWLSGTKIREFGSDQKTGICGESSILEVVEGSVGFIHAQAWGEAERNDLCARVMCEQEKGFEIPCSPYWLREWEERARRLWHLSLTMRVCADSLKGELHKILGFEEEDCREDLKSLGGLVYGVLASQPQWRPSSGDGPADGPWERGNWANGFLLGAYGLATGILEDLGALPDKEGVAAVGYERGMRWLEPPTDGHYTSAHFPSLRHWLKRSTNHGIVILASALVGYSELERLEGSCLPKAEHIELEFWDLLAGAFSDGAYLEGVRYAQFSLQEAIALILYRFHQSRSDWQTYVSQYPYLSKVKEFLYQSAYPGASKPYVYWGDCQVLDWKRSVVNFIDAIPTEHTPSIEELIAPDEVEAPLVGTLDTELLRTEPLSLSTQTLPRPVRGSSNAHEEHTRVVAFPETGLVHVAARDQSKRSDWRACFLATRLHATHNVDHDFGSFFLAVGGKTVIGEVAGRGAWRHSTVGIMNHGLEDPEDPFSGYGGTNKDGLIDRTYGGKFEAVRVSRGCYRVTVQASHGLAPHADAGVLIPEFTRDFVILGGVSPLLLVISRFTVREGFTPYVQYVLPCGGGLASESRGGSTVELNGPARLYLPKMYETREDRTTRQKIEAFRDREGGVRLIEAFSGNGGAYVSVACVASSPESLSWLVVDEDEETKRFVIESVQGSYVFELPSLPSHPVIVTNTEEDFQITSRG